MNKLCLVLVCLCMLGCADMERRERLKVPMFDSRHERFTVRRVAVFEDGLAYNDERGIYLILDEKTGKEYLGISGIGVSELGSHMVGKVSTSNER